MNKQEIQEAINELHRMKKRMLGPHGCSVSHQEANAYSAKCLRIAISALTQQLSELKEPCEYCKANLFNRVGISTDKYGHSIAMGDITPDQRFKLCPMCGRPLNDVNGKSDEKQLTIGDN
jgi:transposase-like protein